MANAIGINGTHKRQEKYADSIVKLMRKEFNIRNEFSRDYEGDPVSGAVNVPVRNGDIVLSDYDILNGITMTQSATDYQRILVDKHKGFSELIDGYEAQAVPDNLVAQRLESAGYTTGKALELDAIAALINGGTTESDTTEVTKSNVYEKIATTISVLKKRGIKPTELRVSVSAETELKLLTDDKFANSAGALGAELLRSGVIGRVSGVNVKPNYWLPDNVEYIVFAPAWCQAIDEWEVAPGINDIKDGKHIGASALQGRMVYEDVVTNALAVQIKTSGTVSH